MIRDSDIWLKEQEFRAYVEEVKQTPWETLSNANRKMFWDSYREDYNTSTMPSIKYYNLALWEKEEMARKIKTDRKRKRYEELQIFDDSGVRKDFNDEEALRRKQREDREKQKERDSLFKVRMLKDQLSEQKTRGETPHL